MPLMHHEEATEILAPYLEGVYDSIHGGVEDFKKLPARTRNIVVAGTRAGFVHDHQVMRAAKFFAKFPGKVRVHELDKLIVFDIEGRIALRYKKVDRGFLSKNQPTAQVAEFRGQISLPGVSAQSNLEAAYVFDDLTLEIEWSGIVCPNNRGVFWKMELREEGAEMNVVDMFDTPEEGKNDGTEFKKRKSGIIIPFRRDGSQT
jgi:hypothetical protein